MGISPSMVVADTIMAYIVMVYSHGLCTKSWVFSKSSPQISKKKVSHFYAGWPPYRAVLTQLDVGAVQMLLTAWVWPVFERYNKGDYGVGKVYMRGSRFWRAVSQ